jgi:uncharacterized cupin superfamily protein
MPKIDIESLEWRGGTGYPAPFRALVEGRHRKRLGEPGGLTQFGVNLTRLAPGAASAQRHWHENEDEFVYILSGEAVLVENDGEKLLGPGDAAAFKAGVANGHHLINRGDKEVFYLEIGSRAVSERAHYPDIDLAMVTDGTDSRFTRKSGDAYD